MTSVGLVSGPTGGHLIPAYLVGKALEDRGADPTLYAPSSDALNLLPDRTFPHVELTVSPWSGQSPIGKVAALYSMFREFLSLRRTMREHDVVISFGGYPSVPALLASWWNDTRVYFQEQNRMPGRTHRLFESLAERIFYGYPPVESVNNGRIEVTGNPVRPPGETADNWFNEDPLLVVLGGSQGSRDVSRYLEGSARELLSRGWRIYYLRGKFGKDLSTTDWASEDTFRQVDYDRDLHTVLPLASCVWSRAGAGTLSELSTYGVPGVVFPFPHATDDHQSANARWVSDHGPVTVVDSGREPSSEWLIEETEALVDSGTTYDVPWDSQTLPQQTIAERVLS